MTKKIWKHRFAIFYFKIFSKSFNLAWRLICLLLWSGQIFMILLIIDVCCYFQVWLNFSLHQSRTWWCYWWDELICWSLVEMCWSGLVETNYQVTSFSVVTRAELRLTWGCTRALAAMGAAPATARSAGGRVVSSRGLHTRGLMDMRSSLCSVILRCIISDISQPAPPPPPHQTQNIVNK